MYPSKNLLRYSVILFACFLLAGCGNVQIPNMQQLLQNLGYSLPPLWSLATAFAYILGMVFILRGVYALKIYGEMRTMSSAQTNIKIPLMYFLVGAVLMFLPTTKDILLSSTFGYGQELPLNYGNSSPIWSAQSTAIILSIVQFVGLVAFIRGWVMLANTVQHGGQQNTFGKALTHIIGGIFAINIEGTRQLFLATFGLNT